jgi:hypothetical protein
MVEIPTPKPYIFMIKVEGESKIASHINSHDHFYTSHSDIYPQIDNIPEKKGVCD